MKTMWGTFLAAVGFLAALVSSGCVAQSPPSLLVCRPEEAKEGREAPSAEKFLSLHKEEPLLRCWSEPVVTAVLVVDKSELFEVSNPAHGADIDVPIYSKELQGIVHANSFILFDTAGTARQLNLRPMPLKAPKSEVYEPTKIVLERWKEWLSASGLSSRLRPRETALLFVSLVFHQAVGDFPEVWWQANKAPTPALPAELKGAIDLFMVEASKADSERNGASLTSSFVAFYPISKYVIGYTVSLSEDGQIQKVAQKCLGRYFTADEKKQLGDLLKHTSTACD